MRIVWTPEMIAYLRANYEHMRAAEIGSHLGLTDTQVFNRAHYEGLRKSRRLPWNTGKKGDMPAGWGSWTAFEKGHQRGTTKPLGSESMRYGKVYVKIAMDGKESERWRPKSILAWERHNGRPVPPNHVVRFRDGDNSNFIPENLYLCSRADMMAQSSLHNLPKPVARLIHLRGVLNRQIKRIENGK